MSYSVCLLPCLTHSHTHTHTQISNEILSVFLNSLLNTYSHTYSLIKTQAPLVTQKGSYSKRMPAPVALLSKEFVCGLSPAEIVGSNPTGRMDVCLLWVLCVVRLRSLRRADHSSTAVLPTVVRHCVQSRNLVNEEALAQWGLWRQKQTVREWTWVSGAENVQAVLVTQNSPLWHLPLSWPKADKQEITILNFHDKEIQLLYTGKDM